MSQVASIKIAEWRRDPDLFVREVFPGAKPDPWQKKVLQAFPSNPRLALVACKGPGKGHSKDLVIQTPEGNKRWGDIKIGDLVFTQDGSPTEVIETHDLGITKSYKVIFDDGSECVCTDEHLWKVKGRTERRKKLDWVVIDTEEIISRGVTIPNGKWQQKQFIIPIQGAAQFNRSEQELDAYVLGVWLGDGIRGRPAYCKPNAEVQNEINRRGYPTGGDINGHITLLNQKSNFLKLQIFDKYSYERFIPDNYKFASVQQRTDLLKGLMDTDGCIGKDSHMEYNTTSKKLADDMVWLVRSLGGIALIKDTIKEGKYRNESGDMILCRDCYRVTVTLPFNPFLIKHKAERWHKPQERYLTRYISSIEEVEALDSMCIKVAHPSACYLTNDFIVTHNTCLLAWLIWNFMLTRPNPKIAVTSITADALADTIWSELALWLDRSPILKQKFTYTKTRIFANEKPETWFVSARPWPKSADAAAQANTLAGLHADYIMFVLDESGGIPSSVMAAAEAALSSCVEGHIVQAGNPTNLEGPLYDAVTKEKDLWHITHITADPEDPDRSPRVSKKWAEEQIQKYGKDHPYVLVNIFGKFPPASFNALISKEDVDAAAKRYYREQDYFKHPKILGVDVAAEGPDSSVIIGRQGLMLFQPLIFRNISGTIGADEVIRKKLEWKSDAEFIDNTGGFGSSWIDNMRRLNYDPIPVHFSETKGIDEKFFNKRAQMTWDFIEWIKAGGAIPDIKELKEALYRITYTHKRDKLIIEPKEDLKIKLGYSPDIFDASILTFSAKVAQPTNTPANNSSHTSRYNPLDINYLKDSLGITANKSPYSAPEKHTYIYNPLDIDYINEG
jgi:phage terminase large subunit